MAYSSKCQKCGMWHLATCAGMNDVAGGGIECAVCPTPEGSGDDGGRAAKRQRKGDKQTLPEDDNLEVDTSM